MEWKKEYSVHVPEVDDSHRVIAEHITEIEQAVAHGEPWLVIHSAIADLTDYTRIHFALEETVMRIQRYPDLQAHINSHNHFLADLTVLARNALAEAGSKCSIEFLRLWFEEHLFEDKKYIASLSGH